MHTDTSSRTYSIATRTNPHGPGRVGQPRDEPRTTLGTTRRVDTHRLTRRHTWTAGVACSVAAGGGAAGGATGGGDGAEVQVGLGDGDIRGKWTRHTHPPARVVLAWRLRRATHRQGAARGDATGRQGLLWCNAMCAR